MFSLTRVKLALSQSDYQTVTSFTLTILTSQSLPGWLSFPQWFSLVLQGTNSTIIKNIPFLHYTHSPSAYPHYPPQSGQLLPPPGPDPHYLTIQGSLGESCQDVTIHPSRHISASWTATRHQAIDVGKRFEGCEFTTGLDVVNHLKLVDKSHTKCLFTGVNLSYFFLLNLDRLDFFFIKKIPICEVDRVWAMSLNPLGHLCVGREKMLRDGVARG